MQSTDWGVLCALIPAHRILYDLTAKVSIEFWFRFDFARLAPGNFTSQTRAKIHARPCKVSRGLISRKQKTFHRSDQTLAKDVVLWKKALPFDSFIFWIIFWGPIAFGPGSDPARTRLGPGSDAMLVFLCFPVSCCFTDCDRLWSFLWKSCQVMEMWPRNQIFSSGLGNLGWQC